jgi:hypothetical protein
MEIKEKMEEMIKQRDNAKMELEKYRILVYKLEGAIEGYQILLDDKKDSKKKEKK